MFFGQQLAIWQATHNVKNLDLDWNPDFPVFPDLGEWVDNS